MTTTYEYNTSITVQARWTSRKSIILSDKSRLICRAVHLRATHVHHHNRCKVSSILTGIAHPHGYGPLWNGIIWHIDKNTEMILAIRFWHWTLENEPNPVVHCLGVIDIGNRKTATPWYHDEKRRSLRRTRKWLCYATNGKEVHVVSSLTKSRVSSEICRQN